MASCIGCFLRKSIVWKMCLLTSSHWDISFSVWKSEPRHLSPPVWADTRLLCWEREWLFRVPLLPLPFRLLCLFPSLFPDLPGRHTKWLKRQELEIRWKEGNEKPRKKAESWIRRICSECWRSALMSASVLGKLFFRFNWHWIRLVVSEVVLMGAHSFFLFQLRLFSHSLKMHVACEITRQVGKSFNVFSLFRVLESANFPCRACLWGLCAKLGTNCPVDGFLTKRLQEGSADLNQGSWKSEKRPNKNVLFLLLRNTFGKNALKQCRSTLRTVYLEFLSGIRLSFTWIT